MGSEDENHSGCHNGEKNVGNTAPKNVSIKTARTGRAVRTNELPNKGKHEKDKTPN